MRALAGMGLLSAAVLLSQVALIRVFSIAQFYHFAFLVISLALLGFGASGSLLALWPRLRAPALWPWHAVGFGLATPLAYLLVNALPFDSYAIAWDPAQLALLVADLLVLAVPFVFAGALVGAMLSSAPWRAGRIYAANLAGSAVGAGIAPLALTWLGSERAVLLSAVLGASAALILAGASRPANGRAPGRANGWASRASATTLVAAVALLVVLPPQFEIRLSPYKRLSQMRLDPAATILASRQDATARLDIVESSTIHSAPGLSLGFLGDLPVQTGLVIDGDALLPVPQLGPATAALARSVPVAVAHAIRPGGRVLLLGSGGGIDAWAALESGATEVTIVEPNRLVHEALAGDLRAWSGLADDPRIRLEHEQLRAFAQRADERFDLVELTLSDNYRPVSSGAVTLTESYTLTVEAIRSYLRLGDRDGIFVLTRWIQSPPSELLRTLGLVIEALDAQRPIEHVVAFRSFQTFTFIVKPAAFTPDETTLLLEAIDRLRYDLVLAPTMPPEMLNRYARLERPIDHELAVALATASDRPGFYAAYDFDISPPTDDHPYFFNFFRWQQTPEVLENLGRRWQPFGGSGYLALVVLLVFAASAAAIFVLAPIALRSAFRAAFRSAGARRATRTLGYFAAIGLAYLFVEVALIQRFILVLGHPTLAMAVVVGALLLASGAGSWLSAFIPWRGAVVALALVLVLYPWLTGLVTPALLAAPLAVGSAAVVALIVPVGFLMGVPFARGIAALEDADALIPWAWAANGSASVVSAVVAAMVALSFGFTPLLAGAGVLYLVAAALIRPRASAART
jgi:spermidine synthase